MARDYKNQTIMLFSVLPSTYIPVCIFDVSTYLWELAYWILLVINCYHRLIIRTKGQQWGALLYLLY